MPPRLRFSGFSSQFFSPQAAVLAAVLGIGIVLGCMSINIGGGSSSTTTDDGTLAQNGSVAVPPNQEVEVFYPTPYGSIPNLTVDDWYQDCSIVAQTDKSFRVRNKSLTGTRNADWKARGVRMITPVIVPPPVETEPHTK